MKYTVAAETDMGIKKSVNQDSVLVKHAETELGEIVLTVVCDGMGGLDKGELASATVIRGFANWFEQELPTELAHPDLSVIAQKWKLMLKELNEKISSYGQRQRAQLGTTVTAILCLNDQYLVVHVGDSRLYFLDDTAIHQLTTDHTFIARELKKGTMTLEQAKVDKRRNMLLQCVGASAQVEPEILYGKIKRGVFLLCSDGFRHEISEAEIFQTLHAGVLPDQKMMKKQLHHLIELVKQRQERDNISAILIKIDGR